jgi:hypothetical protein
MRGVSGPPSRTSWRERAPVLPPAHLALAGLLLAALLSSLALFT